MEVYIFYSLTYHLLDVNRSNSDERSGTVCEEQERAGDATWAKRVSKAVRMSTIHREKAAPRCEWNGMEEHRTRGGVERTKMFWSRTCRVVENGL